jgi:hypothetical protein
MLRCRQVTQDVLRRSRTEKGIMCEHNYNYATSTPKAGMTKIYRTHERTPRRSENRFGLPRPKIHSSPVSECVAFHSTPAHTKQKVRQRK